MIDPNVIIFFTSGWEKNFFRNTELFENFSVIKLNEKYEIKYRKFKDKLYIFSVHPQGKPEKEHIDKIIEIINENEKKN